MELNPKDTIIERYYLGPGKGSSMAAKHLPTGISVAEKIPANSKESGFAIQARLVSALKLKLQQKGKQ